MMTCYLQDTSKFFRFRTLCTSILTCAFSTKGIRLTWFILFDVLGVSHRWGTSVLVGHTRKLAECKWSYKTRNFNMLDKLLRLRTQLLRFLAQSISPSLLVFPFPCTSGTEFFYQKLLIQVAVIAFDWCSYGLALIKRNLKK